MSEPDTFQVSLRRWAEEDWPLLLRLMGDPAMTTYLGGPESLEKMQDRHQRYLRGQPGNNEMFVILIGAEQIAAGSIGYWDHEWQGETVWETGWSVLPEYQGRGIATAAIASLIARVRQDGRRRYVLAYPSIQNGPSNAICRKAGFTLVGVEDFGYPPGNPVRGNVWQLDLAETSVDTVNP